MTGAQGLCLCIPEEQERFFIANEKRGFTPRVPMGNRQLYAVGFPLLEK